MKGIVLCVIFILAAAVSHINCAPVDTPHNETDTRNAAIVAKSSAHVSKRTKIDPYSTIKSYIHPHRKRKHHHRRSHSSNKRLHRPGVNLPITNKVAYFGKGKKEILPAAKNRNLHGDHGDFEVNNGEIFEHGAVPDLRSTIQHKSDKHVKDNVNRAGNSLEDTSGSGSGSGESLLNGSFRFKSLFGTKKISENNQSVNKESLNAGNRVYMDNSTKLFLNGFDNKTYNNLIEDAIVTSNSTKLFNSVENDTTTMNKTDINNFHYDYNYTPEDLNSKEISNNSTASDGSGDTTSNSTTPEAILHSIAQFPPIEIHSDVGDFMMPDFHDIFTHHAKVSGGRKSREPEKHRCSHAQRKNYIFLCDPLNTNQPALTGPYYTFENLGSDMIHDEDADNSTGSADQDYSRWHSYEEKTDSSNNKGLMKESFVKNVGKNKVIRFAHHALGSTENTTLKENESLKNLSQNVDMVKNHTEVSFNEENINSNTNNSIAVNKTNDDSRNYINSTDNLLNIDNSTNNSTDIDKSTDDFSDFDNSIDNFPDNDNTTDNSAGFGKSTGNFSDVDNSTDNFTDIDKSTKNLTDIDKSTKNLTDIDKSTKNLIGIDTSTDNFSIGKPTDNSTSSHNPTDNSTDIDKPTTNLTDIDKSTKNLTDIDKSTKNLTDIDKSTDNFSDIDKSTDNVTEIDYIVKSTDNFADINKSTDNVSDIDKLANNSSDADRRHSTFGKSVYLNDSLPSNSTVTNMTNNVDAGNETYIMGGLTIQKIPPVHVLAPARGVDATASDDGYIYEDNGEDNRENLPAFISIEEINHQPRRISDHKNDKSESTNTRDDEYTDTPSHSDDHYQQMHPYNTHASDKDMAKNGKNVEPNFNDYEKYLDDDLKDYTPDCDYDWKGCNYFFNKKERLKHIEAKKPFSS